MAVVKDKKDTSVLIETHLPEFITESHPKFKKFIEKYYEFMESQQLYFGTSFTFHEPKLQAEDQTGEDYLAYEDNDRLQLESVRDTNNANVQFEIGETLTGNISQATAVVTGTRGNTFAFIKPTNKPSFEYGEKVTGGTSRAYATLANGVVDGTFPKGSIESFRSRGASGAVRDLEPSQDIELTNVGLIDQAWKKEFYVNIPKTAKADRRQLLKHMKKVYRAKGNEASFNWVFRTLFAKEDIEFYYPNRDLLRLSDGKWILDKSIKILKASANNVGVFTGKQLTGSDSKCTALVERQVTYFAGPIEITELFLSNIVQGVVSGVLTDFIIGETVTSDADENGLIAVGTTTGTIQSVTTTIGGTNYVPGNEVVISGGGGKSARARVTSVLDGVVSAVTTVDAGDGYSVGDPLNFINEETGGTGAAGTIKTIIKTGEVLKNTDIIDPYGVTKLNIANYGAGHSNFEGHNANTHLYGNSSLIFSAEIHAGSERAISANGFAPSTSSYNATNHILPGDRIAKQASVDTSSLTITQTSKTVTLSSGLTDAEKRDVVGGKLTYANSNTNIITGFTANNVLIVRDDHVFGSGQSFSIDYASNTYWGTVISANSTEILYSLGSYYRNPDLDNLTVNNFADLDNIIIYDSKTTKLGAAASASGVDAHSMHNGVTFQFGNTPVSNTTSPLSGGTLTMTSVDVGAIDTFTLSSGGTGYTSKPPVLVANSYIPALGNALDVMGANNHLVNVNLHSYSTGTIAQNGTTVTLDSDGSFPDANSGVLTLTYANGDTAQVTSVTNSSTLTVSTDKLFGIGLGSSPDRETYSLSYRAHANNFTKNSLLYNDDYSARGIVLDFLDTPIDRIDSPAIANGNTTLRVDMTTTQDFGGLLKYYIFVDNTGPGTLSCVKNGTTTVVINDSSLINRTESIMVMENGDYITTEDGNRIVYEGPNLTDALAVGMLVEGTGIPGSTTIASITNSTTFVLSAAATDSLTSTLSFTSADVGDDILQEDGISRFYTEASTSDRLTAHSNSVSTYTTGTITQSGTTVTGVGTVFPNDFVRGTITYADDATSTITGYTNSTSFTVADSKTIGSGQSYSISYNPVLTWGTARNITVSAGNKDGETGNRTVTVGENGHSLRTGDKIKITGSDTAIFNGVFPVTVSNDTYGNTYTYTLPENNSVTSPAGFHKATSVASAYLATSNGVTIDTSIKGKNAVLEVSTISIGAIQNVSVYDFGAGYDSAPTISTVSGDQNASFTATIGALATYAGYTSGTTGTLSGVPKLQDNVYYQAFSYVLKTDFDVNVYRDSIKRLTHPSGMVMFGEVAIRNKTNAALYNAANNTVHDLKNLPAPYQTNEGRIYHNVVLLQNAATTNVQMQTFGSNNELEIYTADHPWQAMDARLEMDDAVNFQFEAYEEIDSIARINSTMHTVTQTFHGLEAGDEIEISGDLTEPHEWGGRHVITGVPTPNTYTIIPKTDVFDPEYQGAVLYDGTLQIRLEDGEQDPDTLTGNNVIMEDGIPDYSTAAHKRFTIDNLFSVNVAVANTTYTGDIITNHATFGSATKKFTVTGYNTEIGFDPSKKAFVVGTETAGTFVNTDTVYLHSSSGSNKDVAGGKTINSDLTSVGVYSGTTSTDTFSLVDGIIPSHYLKAKTVAYANTWRNDATNWDDPFSGKILVEETQAFILMLMEDGDNIITEDGYRISRDGIARDVFDLKLERGGTYLYPSIQFPEAETGTISIDMSFNSDVLLEDDNGAYGWGYILDETSEGMGNGPQRYISLEEDTEGIVEGHITQSIPYMETQTTLDVFQSLSHFLITEDGDRIVSEENLRTRWTVGLEVDIGGVGSILTEAGEFIECELNSAIFWNDPHEIYSNITTPEGILLEYASSAVRKLAPVYQFIDYLDTLGRILTEDDQLLSIESNYRHDIQEGHFSLERQDYFTDENNEVQVEFNLEESFGSHIITEDYNHLIVEGDETAHGQCARLITEEPHVKTSLREIEYSNHYGAKRWSLNNLREEIFNDWKDTNIATIPYGVQPFRPHYYSQWSSIGLDFNDGKFVMEDNTGIILLEHPVTNQDKLIQEDYPALFEDIMNTDKAEEALILLENQTGWSNNHFDYIRTEDGIPPGHVNYVGESEWMEDRMSLEWSNPSGGLQNGEVTAHQAWTVLPAYQYTRIPTRLSGLITIADGATAVTGTEYCKFTTELKVGEEFQTEDVTIIAEDSGGDVVLETNERLEHEEITMGDIDAFTLESTKNIRLMDFRWLISSEDSTIAAHSAHANVLGLYLERQMSLAHSTYSAETLSNIGNGGDEETAWDTNDESYWFVTNESDDRGEIDLEDSSGVLLRESLEWNNNNILWEDFSKQLIVEPQAFIVDSITNDSTMSVTRKHLGGVTGAEYRL